jgi:hypothetical protein
MSHPCAGAGKLDCTLRTTQFLIVLSHPTEFLPPDIS